MHQLVNTEMQKVVDFCVYLHTHLPGSSDFLCFVHCQIVEVQRCKAIYDHVAACKFEVMSSLCNQQAWGSHQNAECMLWKLASIVQVCMLWLWL